MSNLEQAQKENLDEQQQSASAWESLTEPSVNPPEAEAETPETRFHVNPADYTIFSQQSSLGEKWGDRVSTKENLDKTLGTYVAATADTIAVLAGEDQEHSGEQTKTDHVIYLDKSARPVSWLVNEFWSDFTDQAKPEESFLAIDRKEWFRRSGVNLGNNEYIDDGPGEAHLARFADFKKENIPRETFARIRALYIPDGIEDEDVDKIMSTPTSLDGKNVTIVDEVSRSGSTVEIAKWLLSQAIPDAHINSYVFWSPSTQIDPTGENDPQIRSVPVWYSASDARGRGIGDIRPEHFAEAYRQNPNPVSRAKNFGSLVLGVPIDLEQEPGKPSLTLQQEIHSMHEAYDNGHVLMRHPSHYDQDAWVQKMESLGVDFVRPERAKHDPKSYLSLCDKQEN